MKYTLLAVLLLASLSAMHAADGPASHRLVVTDYGGNRVCIVSASGEIEWEYPATTPQDCWMLANGNVLFSQSTGAVEVTRDKQVVWQYTAPPQARVHSCQPLSDGSVLVAEMTPEPLENLENYIAELKVVAAMVAAAAA